MEVTEPLMQDDGLQLLPPRRPDIWAMYKKAQSAFWVAEELDLAADREHFEERLTASERHFVKHILSFFAQIDQIVFDNTRTFLEDVKDRSCKAFYAFQAAIECLHAETYQIFIDTLIRDAAERARVSDAIKRMPVIAAKAAWVRKWMDASTATFGERVLAFCIVEAVTFSASFCAIGWLRKRNLLPGLGTANQLIMRDEGLHAQFGVLLMNEHVRGRPAPAVVVAMLREAVEIEESFVRDALPVGLIGMNADAMIEYIHYVADALLSALHEPKLYHATHPFEWMTAMELYSHNNFFEHRGTAYAKAGVGVAAAKQVFALNEEF